jgi:hypothetical protein
MSSSAAASVSSMFVKAGHGEPMRRTFRLALDPVRGISGDVNPSDITPRQICLTTVRSLRTNGIDPAAARANLVLDGERAELVDSGGLIRLDDVLLRVTMVCEPCAHGAGLAGVSTRQLRGLRRHLAVVVSAGNVVLASSVAVEPDTYERIPETFSERSLWAAARIPAGRVVDSQEFLTAIGGSRSYSRVLPRWLRSAKAAGMPVHRILTASLGAPTWAPDAEAILAGEGLAAGAYATAAFPLTRKLWFDHDLDADHVEPRSAPMAHAMGAGVQRPVS